MKKGKRITQALVVIIVVGIGCVHNLDKKSFIYEQLRTKTVSLESGNDKTDSLQVKENNIYIFTKNLIGSSIQHLILNL
jgi:hypothetical protein